MLSKRHWDLFPDNIKKSEKEKNLKKINLIHLKKKNYCLLVLAITGKK